MTYFNVIFIFQVHGCFAGVSSMDIWLEKRAALPFPPYTGLRYQYKEFEAQVNEVIYRADESLFKCYCGEDKEIYEAQLRREKHRTVEEIAQEYIDTGWEKRRL